VYVHNNIDTGNGIHSNLSVQTSQCTQVCAHKCMHTCVQLQSVTDNRVKWTTSGHGNKPASIGHLHKTI